MAHKIRDIMTAPAVCLDASESVSDAAKYMRDNDVGDVLVMQGGELCGIVTDRDIVVRCIAEGQDPSDMSIEDICSSDVITLSPDDTIDDAVAYMRDKAVRRIPVVHDEQVLGVVSLGDLARERDPRSALGEISSATANR